jgi:hypothetical protein
MVNIQLVSVAFAAFFFSTLSQAQTYGNDNPNEDPYDDLYDYAYGQPQKEETINTYRCQPTNSTSFANRQGNENVCKGFGADYMQWRLQFASADDHIGYSGGTETISGSSNQLYSYSVTESYRYTFNNGVTQTRTRGRSFAYQLIPQNGETTTICPPDSHPSNTFTANVGDTKLCFDPLDLGNRDSCPNSSNDGNYLLPAGTNSSEKTCLDKDDGSRCSYTKYDDVYIADYESSCYLGTDNSYDETGFNQPDPNGQCQYIGNGVTACPELESNVCTDGACLEGCGNVEFGGESAFMCLSDDTDSDGIGDYADPDIDGDGIANNEDLDADGDGADDPDYDNDDTDSPSQDIAFDNSAVEGELSALNATNTQIKAGIDAVNSNLNSGLGALNVKTQSILDEVSNKDNVDLSGMTPTDELTGFYEAEYPNGWEDVWTANEAGFNASAPIEYIQTWEVAMTGDYTYPQICADIGIVDLGCHEVNIDPRVFPFIRIVMIISALFLARQITLGA